MIPLPSKEMNVNKFVDVKLPTKRQIFSRVGGYSSGEMYSGDDSIRPGMHPTEQADALARAAERHADEVEQQQRQEQQESKEDLPE